MLKNKINKMKKFIVYLSILVSISIGAIFLTHHHVSAYCLKQKQLTDSIEKSDSLVKASAIIDSMAKNDSTVLIIK